ncbi:TetR/AcrR family transcriptional regulator [Kineococcus gynurae]|uniref:TetR/AcrR family transcriptional regulator n=1 Tax=Kineococcus gynurae TaxID=452979 RepID=A0ABV5LXF4_9ACTN
MNRPRRETGGRREDLVAAAARVLARDGVAATTTRGIAAEAGVPLGTVHYWFAGKDALLHEVALAHTRRVADAAAGEGFGGSAAGEAAARLRAAFAVVRTAGRGERLASLELLSWALRTPGKEDLAAEQVRVAREVAETAIEPWRRRHGGDVANREDGSGADPDLLAVLVAALVDGLATAELADPAGTRAEEVLDLLADLLSGITRTTG